MWLKIVPKLPAWSSVYESAWSGSFAETSCILSYAAIYRFSSWDIPLEHLNSQCLYHNLPSIKYPAPLSNLCPARSSFTTSKNIQIYFLPSQLIRLLALITHANHVAGCPGFTLHTVSRLHWPELHQYW